MDIYCKRCGEPWDMLSVREDMEAVEQRRFWGGSGCPCCYGKEVEHVPAQAGVMAVLHDVLGDDVDGIAAELEDLKQLDQVQRLYSRLMNHGY